MKIVKRFQEMQEEIGFQMAPLIDIIFLLLVFFIVTSALERMEKAIQIALPTAGSASDTKRLSREIIINILKDGTLIVNNHVITPEELRDKLKRLSKYAEGQNVIIRADKKTYHENVVRVLDLCANSGIRNISFVTIQAEDTTKKSKGIKNK